MLEKVKVGLRPVMTGLNIPTVMKTAVLPGDTTERLFIATQVGEIFYTGDTSAEIFLDIRHRIIRLGASGGYDERGLLGLAFHPGFRFNGMFISISPWSEHKARELSPDLSDPTRVIPEP